MSESPISDYRKVFFEKYRTTQFNQLYGEENIESIKASYKTWKWYYSSILPENKSAKIVDMGCGSGGFMYWLRSLGYSDVTGVDLSLENCEQATHLGIDGIVNSDIMQFLAGNRRYDVVIMRDVLEHLNKNEILAALSAVHQALNPGGMLILQVPNSEGLFGARLRYSDFTHEVSFTSASLRQLLSVSGFLSVLFKETGPVPHGLPSFFRWIVWRGLKTLIKMYFLIEDGATTGVYTQILIACAKR